jgi:hypothetical protein
MEKWEIIPHGQELAVAMHIRETPDYYSRSIWAGSGYWPIFRKSVTLWNDANCGGGYVMNTSHAYDKIIRENKAVFDEHLEYYGLINGKRGSSKFCISNPGLRKLVVNYAIKSFEKKTTLDSISMDPSDGGGWCECAECAKIGSPSDRALFLANTVAKALRSKFSGKRVGMYAYGFHSPPPNIDVDQDVVINIATSFIRGGYTLNGLIKGWKKKKATIGIREYYNVYSWSYNAPGQSNGSNVAYLQKTIPEFYHQGARYMSAESGDNWGSNGLGYYLAERMMWDIENSKKLYKFTEEFLKNCFGPAAGTMGEFYKLIDGANNPKLCSDLIGRMYRLLAQSRKEAAGNLEILERLDDLVIYTRYCELLMAYLHIKEKKKTLENLIQLVCRSKSSRMVHSRSFLKYAERISKKNLENIVTTPDNLKPFTQEEINNFIMEGIAANKLLDFTPMNFSDKLVPAVNFKKQKLSDGKPAVARRGTVTYYTWADDKLSPVKLSVTGGLIKHYRDRGNVRIKFYKLGGASETGTKESLIQTDSSVPPDGIARTVILTPKQSGLHKIVISDGRDKTEISWDKGTPMTFGADGSDPVDIVGTFYFYVPKGTEKIGFFCDMKRGYIVSPDGKKEFKFSRTLGFFSFGVPKGMDGKVWKLYKVLGRIGLMTSPPYLAAEPSGIMLPEETVIKDKL